MIIQRTIDIEVPRLIVDGVPVTVDDIKPQVRPFGPHWSEVFVDGYARCHLLPDSFLPGLETPRGTLRTGGHTFQWETTHDL